MPPAGTDLAVLSLSAAYVGSKEHKAHPGPELPQGGLRSDATPCPKELTGDFGLLTRWVREAIAAGDVGGEWDPGMYPRYAWRRVDGVVWMGRVVNPQQGTDKGGAARPGEPPRWLL